MALSWFPGHMAKAISEIKGLLKLIDVVIEITDARAPLASSNEILSEITGDRPKVVVLNKADLADDKATEEWMKYFENKGCKAVKCNCMLGNGVSDVVKAAKSMSINAFKEKGKDRNKKIRALVVGLPNVGKSSFINRVAKKAKTKVGDKPGVTRSKQWIEVDSRFEILDTPGIMPPKVDDPSVWFCLSALGMIDQDLLDLEALAVSLITVCEKISPESIISKYNLVVENESSAQMLDMIAKKRGCLKQGGIPETDKAAEIVIREFRAGKIGRISLERPQEKVLSILSTVDKDEDNNDGEIFEK